MSFVFLDGTSHATSLLNKTASSLPTMRNTHPFPAAFTIKHPPPTPAMRLVGKLRSSVTDRGMRLARPSGHVLARIQSNCIVSRAIDGPVGFAVTGR